MVFDIENGLNTATSSQYSAQVTMKGHVVVALGNVWNKWKSCAKSTYVHVAGMESVNEKRLAMI